MPTPSSNLPVSPEFKKAWAAMKQQLDLIGKAHGEHVVENLLSALSKDPSKDLGKALKAALTQKRAKTEEVLPEMKLTLRDLKMPTTRYRRPGGRSGID